MSIDRRDLAQRLVDR